MPSPSIPPTSHHEPDTNHTERVEAGLHLARFLGTSDRQSWLNRSGLSTARPRSRGANTGEDRARSRQSSVERCSCYTCSDSSSTTPVFTDGLYRSMVIGRVWRPKPGLPGRVRSVETYSQSGSRTAERSSRSAFASVPAGGRRSKCWRAGRPIRTRRPSKRIPTPDHPVRPQRHREGIVVGSSVRRVRVRSELACRCEIRLSSGEPSLERVSPVRVDPNTGSLPCEKRYRSPQCTGYDAIRVSELSLERGRERTQLAGSRRGSESRGRTNLSRVSRYRRGPLEMIVVRERPGP